MQRVRMLAYNTGVRAWLMLYNPCTPVSSSERRAGPNVPQRSVFTPVAAQGGRLSSARALCVYTSR